MNAQTLEKLKSAASPPTPIGAARRLLDAPDAESAMPDELVEAIASDVGMAASVLRFANTRAPGQTGGFASVRDVVERLGTRTARVAAVSHLLVDAELPLDGGDQRLIPLWRRAAARALSARTIARALDPRRAVRAHQAAVLADVAIATLHRVEEVAAVLRGAADEHAARAHAEQLCGAPSMAASAWLLRRWKFPKRLCAGLAYAGGLPLSETAKNDDEVRLLTTVLLASDAIAAHALGEIPREAALSRARDAGAYVAPIGASRWDDLLDECKALWGAAGWTHEAGDAASWASVRGRARVMLAQLSLETQFENRLIKSRQTELLRRVTTDALTGVKNRLAFDERLEEEFERSQRAGKPMALLLCDLDGFKLFNDRYGHQAGDLMLRTAALSLSHAARRIDMVARYGGEEFAVIAPSCGPAGAAALAERLRRAVQEIVIDWRGEPLRTTISIGGAIMHGGGSERSPSELIEAADRLLYGAKGAGRNRCIVEPCALSSTPAN